MKKLLKSEIYESINNTRMCCSLKNWSKVAIEKKKKGGGGGRKCANVDAKHGSKLHLCLIQCPK